MEEVRIICTPFIITAIVFTVFMLYHDLKWKKKNPWWRQDDDKMRLSPAEKAYRQTERRKQNNALMIWFLVLFTTIGVMIIVLSAHVYGGITHIGEYWFYLIPFVGAILLTMSGMRINK